MTPSGKRTVLVTGASGFVGGALVRALQAAGDDVVCLVRPSSNRSGLDGVRFAVGDMADARALQAAMAGVDVVYHAAAVLKAPWRKDFDSANIDGAACVAAACAAMAAPPILVLVSSLAAAGPTLSSRARIESDPPAPVSRYGRAKLACERVVARVAGQVPVSIVRPPMVTGGGDLSALPLFRLATRGVRLSPGPLAQKLSLIDVDDLARLLRLVATAGERLDPAAADASGQGIYFATGSEATTWGDLADAVAIAVGRPGGLRVTVPKALIWLAAAAGETVGRLRDEPTLLNLDKAREASAGAWWCSGAKAVDGLGFRATPLAASLLATADGYRQRGWL